MGPIIVVDVVSKNFVEELVGLREHVGWQVGATIGLYPRLRGLLGRLVVGIVGAWSIVSLRRGRWWGGRLGGFNLLWGVRGE
jgi:hypothetical protein